MLDKNPDNGQHLLLCSIVGTLFLSADRAALASKSEVADRWEEHI